MIHLDSAGEAESGMFFFLFSVDGSTLGLSLNVVGIRLTAVTKVQVPSVVVFIGHDQLPR
jgi:hypothetical protein